MNSGLSTMLTNKQIRYKRIRHHSFQWIWDAILKGRALTVGDGSKRRGTRANLGSRVVEARVWRRAQTQGKKCGGSVRLRIFNRISFIGHESVSMLPIILLEHMFQGYQNQGDISD